MNWNRVRRVVFAGLIGTVAMTFMAYLVAPVMLGHPMDIAEMLAGVLGVSWKIGMMMHVMNGLVIFPLIYVIIADRLLPGAPWLKGLFFGIALWLALEVIMLPMSGAGLFGMNGGGPKAVMAALIAHLIYGTLLGWTFGNIGEGVRSPLKERTT